MSERKDQIIHAALTVFSRYGLRRSSMQDVAAEAGLSRPALYQYFRNKDDLIAECVDMVGVTGCAQSETAAAAQTTPRARVTAYLATYMIYYYRLLISGPHSADVLALKQRFGPDKIARSRQNLTEKLNNLAGLAPDDQRGVILTHSAEGLKLYATDETQLNTQISALVSRFIPD